VNRVLEPELMDGHEQCYDYMMASNSRNDVKSAIISKLCGSIPLTGTVADLGCGTGDYMVSLCNIFPVNVVGYDDSPSMINLANETIVKNNLQSRCQLYNTRFVNIAQREFDTTFSSLTLHHQHDPTSFWNTIKTITKDNGYVFVADLLRPNSLEEVDKIVTEYSKNESLQFQLDHKNSLMAAFTIVEIVKQVEKANLNLVIERHGQIFMAYGQITK